MPALTEVRNVSATTPAGAHGDHTGGATAASGGQTFSAVLAQAVNQSVADAQSTASAGAGGTAHSGGHGAGGPVTTGSLQPGNPSIGMPGHGGA